MMHVLILKWCDMIKYPMIPLKELDAAAQSILSLKTSNEEYHHTIGMLKERIAEGENHVF